MKIVALVRTGYSKTYLAEVSDDEIATITRGAITSTSEENSLKVGSEIKLGDHWARVKYVESMQGRIESAAKSLHAVADLLATVEVIVQPKETNQ